MTAPEQRRWSGYDGIDADPALAVAEGEHSGFRLRGPDATDAEVSVELENDQITLIVETEGETAEASIGAHLDAAAADALATTLRDAAEWERQGGHE